MNNVDGWKGKLALDRETWSKLIFCFTTDESKFALFSLSVLF
jgi:hypothetical protein